MQNHPSSTKLRSVVIDDNWLYAEAVEKIVNRLDFIECNAIFDDALNLLSRLEELKPDFVFVDVFMQPMDGYELTAIIAEKYPNIRVIGISICDEGETVGKMLDAGAWGYIGKSEKPKEFNEMFQSIRLNKKYISPAAARNYALTMNQKERKHNKEGNVQEKETVHISPREREVIRH